MLKVYDISCVLDWDGPVTGIPRVVLSIAEQIAKREDFRFCFFNVNSADFEVLPCEKSQEFILNYDKFSIDDKKTIRNCGKSLSDYSDKPVELILYGAGWSYVGFTKQLANYKKQFPALRTCIMIYDLTPLLFPETFGEGFPPVYVDHVFDLIHLADGVVYISKNSLIDVEELCRKSGMKFPLSSIVYLGFDIKQNSTAKDSSFSLPKRPYILCVGRLEARKNQVSLVEVWNKLKLGSANVPQLVLVGRGGWKTDLIFKKVAEYKLEEDIVWLQDVADGDLEALYKNCMFTVYPSLYEGWGLPIVESLFFNKHCITSNTSSMVEASQGFADCLPPLDIDGWSAIIMKYLSEPKSIIEHEEKLKKSFRPITWKSSFKCHDEFWTKIGEI